MLTGLIMFVGSVGWRRRVSELVTGRLDWFWLGMDLAQLEKAGGGWLVCLLVCFVVGWWAGMAIEKAGFDYTCLVGSLVGWWDGNGSGVGS